MLDESTRNAILRLHKAGHGARAIARALKISRGAVRDVLRSGTAQVPVIERSEKAAPHEAEIRELYARCEGNLVRVHEELTASGAKLSYAALTGYCRRHEIGTTPVKPAGRYDFAPGEEMQHDTSPHRIDIAGKKIGVQTASLVLCFSRMLFFQFFRSFDRFACKVFLTDALQYFVGAAARCMVDNTSVIRLHGTGKDMVPAPEMVAFAERFGFDFEAHEVGDADRSARVERPFEYIEGNFLVGRSFTDIAHANAAAVGWCDKVNATYKRHLHARPRELLAVERPALKPLPIWIPEVYRIHTRIVDIEGFVHVAGVAYSVPYQLIGRQLEIRETKDRIVVFDGPRIVAEHGKGKPGGFVTCIEHRPKRGTGGAAKPVPPEQQELAAAEPDVAAYAQTLRTRAGLRWPVALRRLAQMRRDYPRPAFLAAVATAAHYGLYDLDRLERIVLRNIAHDYFVVPANRPEDDPEDDDER